MSKLGDGIFCVEAALTCFGLLFVLVAWIGSFFITPKPPEPVVPSKPIPYVIGKATAKATKNFYAGLRDGAKEPTGAEEPEKESKK